MAQRRGRGELSQGLLLPLRVEDAGSAALQLTCRLSAKDRGASASWPLVSPSTCLSGPGVFFRNCTSAWGASQSSLGQS